MMTLAQLERLALVVLILVFLLVGLITTGKIKAAETKSGGTSGAVFKHKQEYMPLSKEAQYVVMTVEEYNELVEKKCK